MRWENSNCRESIWCCCRKGLPGTQGWVLLCDTRAMGSHTGHPMAPAHRGESHTTSTAPREGSLPVPRARAESWVHPTGSLLVSCCRLPALSPATRRCIRRIPTSSLSPQGMGTSREAAGGFTSHSRDPATSQGAHRGNTEILSVSLTVIQLGLCQKEVAAWRNASTF